MPDSTKQDILELIIKYYDNDELTADTIEASLLIEKARGMCIPSHSNQNDTSGYEQMDICGVDMVRKPADCRDAIYSMTAVFAHMVSVSDDLKLAKKCDINRLENKLDRLLAILED